MIGSSLGAAASVLAEPPLPIDALVLEAVYPTIERATENRLAQRFGPLLYASTSRQAHRNLSGLCQAPPMSDLHQFAGIEYERRVLAFLAKGARV